MEYTYKYPRPCVTVDAAVLSGTGREAKILLIERNNYPYEGRWALPGGFVDMNETLEQAVVRELEEETGLNDVSLKQFHAFSAVDRDPRDRTISVVFWGILEKDHPVHAGDDARNAAWFNINTLPELAFDHAEIIKRIIDQISPIS